jgi:hypothetical protein
MIVIMMYLDQHASSIGTSGWTTSWPAHCDWMILGLFTGYIIGEYRQIYNCSYGNRARGARCDGSGEFAGTPLAACQPDFLSFDFCSKNVHLTASASSKSTSAERRSSGTGNSEPSRHYRTTHYALWPGPARSSCGPTPLPSRLGPLWRSSASPRQEPRPTRNALQSNGSSKRRSLWRIPTQTTAPATWRGFLFHIVSVSRHAWPWHLPGPPMTTSSVNTPGKAGAKIPHLPLGDDPSPRGR